VRFHLEPEDEELLLRASRNWTMSTGTSPAYTPETAPKRKVARYKLAVPADLTVLRSGIPDRIPGRTLEVGEGGVGVVVASGLLLGESVRVEFLLPHTTTPVRATAVVRYEHKRSFGLQFLRLPVEQQSIIRYWTRCEGEVLLTGHRAQAAQLAAFEEAAVAPEPFQNTQLFRTLESATVAKRAWDWRRMMALAAPIFLVAGGLGWWQWQQGWVALEAPVLAKEPAKPQFLVPAEVMQQRVRHKVVPEYPEAARQAGVQGTVVLDAVVNPDGTVAQVKVLSGPQVLAQAALDAVRWWRYEPYSVNGRAATVETTVSVGFQLAN
jgi:TonB family protein